MAEYIEREAALKLAHYDDHDVPVIDVENIEALPAADVAPVRHGRNICDEIHGHIEFKCSLCGCELSTVYGGKNDCGMDGGYFNYCPNCGAKMGGET